jgi:serine/threonine-protein kinase ULK4
VPLKTID